MSAVINPDSSLLTDCDSCGNHILTIFSKEPGEVGFHCANGCSEDTIKSAREGLQITDWGSLEGQHFEPIDWVIEDLLPPGVSMLSGRPKQGKSWLVHAWALLIAAGKPVFGMITNRCKTLYLALEDSNRRLQGRTKKLMRTHGIGHNDLSGYFFTVTEAHKLGEGLEEQIAATLKKTLGIRLVIIDVLARVRPYRKPQQSVYEADYAVGKMLKEIGKQYPDVSFLIVHHNNKGSSDALDSISGTHGLAGGMDNTFSIMNTGQGLELHINGRDIEKSDSIPLVQGMDGMFTLEDRDSAFRKSMSISRGKIMDAIKEGVDTPKDIAIETGLKTNTIHQQLHRMVKAGVLTKSAHGKYQVIETPTYTPHK